MNMTKNINFLISAGLIFICLIFFLQEASATHIVGGDVSYKCLGGDEYEITLTVRRDCENADPLALFDDPATIGIFDPELGNLLPLYGHKGMLFLDLISQDTIITDLNDDCGVMGSLVCVQEGVYKATVSLPFRDRGYLLSYQRCCRNETLNNILDPLETGSTYYIEISPESLMACNSSPVFDQWPDIYICANETLSFVHSATDADGDSLVYKLCTPKTGATIDKPKPQPPSSPPYDDVIFANPPYSLDNLLGGDPLTINQDNGLITAVPDMVGQFLVGVCVEEYRDGVLLSTLRRDFEYNVRVCGDAPVASFEAPSLQCDNLSIAFNNTSTNAEEYMWFFDFPNTDPAFTSTLEDPNFTYPDQGEYTVRLIATRTADGCTDETSSQLLVFNDPITADFEVGFNSCTNDLIDLTLTDASVNTAVDFPINAWSWTVTQGTSITNLSGPMTMISLNPNQMVEVELVVSSTAGCTATTSQTLTVDDILPTADFDVSLNGCSPDGFNVSLSENSNQTGLVGASWNWTINDGGSTSSETGNPIDIDVENSVFSVTLEVVFDNGCTAEVTREIDIADFLPIADFTLALESCGMDDFAITLTDNTSNVSGFVASGWDWNINDGTSNIQLIGNPISAVVSSTTINVGLVVSFDNGCTVDIDREVDFSDQLPSVMFTPEIFQCQNDDTVDVSLTANSTSSVAATSNTWMVEFADGSMQNFVGNPIVITMDRGTEATVKVTTVYENGCEAVFEGPVSPDVAFLEFISAPTIEICEGDTTNIIANPNSNWTYTWSPMDGLDFGSATDFSNPEVSVVENTTYNVTVTDGICTDEGSITIAVTDMINLIVAGETDICDENIELVVSGGSPGDTYEWSTDDTFNNIISTNDTLIATLAGDSITYYVQLAASSKCASEVTSITVYDRSIQADFFEPFSICPGDTLEYPVFSQMDDVFVWQDDPHIISGGDTNSPLIGVGSDETDDFELIFTASNEFGCVLTDTIDFILSSPDSLDFNTNLLECGEFTICFDNTSPMMSGIYSWDFGDPTTDTDISIETEPGCYTYPGPGVYTATLTNISAVCAGVTSVQEVIVPEPISISIDSDTLSLCPEEIATVTADSNFGEGSISWCDDMGNEIGTGGSIEITAGQFDFIVVKSTNSFNCSDSLIIEIDDYQFNLEIIAPAEEICAGESTLIELVNLNADENLSYEWSPADCIVNGGNTATPTVSADESKVLIAQVTNLDNGCMTEIQVPITISSVNVEITADPDGEINAGEQVEITANTTGDIETILWDNGVSDDSQIVGPSETTTYTVTVTDENGCTGTDDITIVVRSPLCGEEDIFIPNAFTPNGDDVNDILYVRSAVITELEFFIVNRWGQEVFRTNRVGEGWNGTFDGEKVAPDSYAYCVKATCLNGVQFVKSGNVTLLE